MDSTKTTWDENIGNTCNQNVISMTTQLNDQLTQLALYPANPSTQALADSAAKQLDYFTNMCGCINESLDKITPLAGAGVLGAIGCFMAFIMQIGLCSTMGCCTKYEKAAAKVSPQA